MRRVKALTAGIRPFTRREQALLTWATFSTLTAISAAFSLLTTPTSSRESPSTTEPDFASTGTLKVYVWPAQSDKDTGVSDPGHTAVEAVKTAYPGEAPKTYYASIWPGPFPSIGPLILIPLPAASTLSLEEDAAIPLSRHVAERPRALNEKQEIPHGMPRYTFECNGVNIEAAKHEMDRLKEGMRRNRVGYQFLPFIPTTWLILAVLAKNPVIKEYARNPFLGEELPTPDLEADGRPEAHNCVTLALAILGAAGLKIRTNPICPWGMSPDRLAYELRRHPRCRLIQDTEKKPMAPSKADPSPPDHKAFSSTRLIH